MAPDDYQQAWQSHTAQARVTIDADLLLKEVQRNQRDFRAMVSLEDFGEVAFALLLLPVWIYMGVKLESLWTWYLMVPASVWIMGYILVYRMRHRQEAIAPDEPLRHCVERSLKEVEDRIWLKRNIFWWYFLPLGISTLTFIAHLSWLKATDYLDALSDVNAFVFVFSLAVFYFVYRISRRAAASGLESRRQELLSLLGSLTDESSSEESRDAVTGAVSRLALHKRVTQPSAAGFAMVLLGFVVGALVLLVGLFAPPGETTESSYNGSGQSSGTAGDSLAGLISDLRKEQNLVGLAAMVMVDGNVEAAAVHGERKVHSGVPLEIGDRWHLGGITSSITATMIGRLVESGQMQWTDTVDDIFPEAVVHEDWKPVTVRQLLTQTAGAPANFSLEVRKKRPALGAECTKARREAVLEVISEKANQPADWKFASNVSPTIAAAMAEKVTGDTWENLVQELVFEPLELTGAGFGPPKSSDKALEQPRGHLTLSGKRAVKFGVNDGADNTPIMGPAGSVHMTLGDLCTYATEHLRGYFREGQLLSTETHRVLHTPELDQYACGWVRKKPSQSFPYTVYWHNGSNTLWYALVAFIPEKNMVVAVTSNDGDYTKAEAAAWEIVKASVMPDNLTAERPDEGEYPKKAPFTAVRWQGTQPEVRLGDEWSKLVSLDGLPASEIVAFSQRAEGGKWRKRFEEDLVELLTRMGHPPRDKVTLVVESLTSGEKSTRQGVPMTEENRQAIWEASNGATTKTRSSQ